MICIINEHFVCIEPWGSGVKIRTAVSLQELLTDLMKNSGEEIAFWAEGEAKRIADVWRERLSRCERCDGAGEIAHPDAGDTESEDATVPCPLCGGDGKPKS